MVVGMVKREMGKLKKKLRLVKEREVKERRKGVGKWVCVKTKKKGK